MAKKKKDSWVDKLKKKVKERLAKERQKNQDLRDRTAAEKLRKQGVSEEDIKKMGYGKKEK